MDSEPTEDHSKRNREDSAWEEADWIRTPIGEEARHLQNMSKIGAALLFIAADRTGYRLHAKPEAYDIDGQLIEGKDLISIYIVDDVTYPSYPNRLFAEYERLRELVPTFIRSHKRP